MTSQAFNQNFGYEGMEVVPDNVDKVVIPNQAEKVVLPSRGYDGKEVLPYDSKEALAETAQQQKGRSSIWRRKRYVAVGFAILIAVITASVVGGVQGSKASGTSDSTPSPTSSSSSAAISPTSIASRSPLAVTGTQSADQSQHGILLTYEAPDGTIHLILGSNIDNNTDTIWGTLQPLETGMKTANGTGLAITSITNSTGGISEQLFIDETFILQSMVDSSESRQQGYRLSNLGKKEIAATAGSKLASYGPWIVVQMVSGYFLAIWHELSTQIWYSIDLNWINAVMPGTKIAIVPLAKSFKKLSEGNLGFVFQQHNGKLTAFSSPDDFKMPTMPPKKTAPNNSSSSRLGGSQESEDAQRRQSRSRSWPPADQFPDIRLRLGASFAALSVARSDSDREDIVNTFIVYQDDDSDIKQVWTDDGQSWRKSSPRALKGADNGTDITCVTLSTWDGSRIVEPSRILTANHMARCYFQRGGRVIEVRLQGNDWAEHGILPLS